MSPPYFLAWAGFVPPRESEGVRGFLNGSGEGFEGSRVAEVFDSRSRSIGNPRRSDEI